MNEIFFDLLELLGCGVNGTKPSASLLDRYSMQSEDAANRLDLLYRLSRAHFVEALVGTVLKRCGVSLPEIWNQSIAKAIRKVILFDEEREALFKYLENRGIWYMPLKGIILKGYYPAIGMRQMSDNDILFDEVYAEDVCNYMISRGYTVESYGKSNHDVYEKTPIYNFEMHRSLYGVTQGKLWNDYYSDIKSRLIRDDGSSFGYHMTDEDFYVYIVSHGYKHHKGSGTGIRTLLDYYVYLQRNERNMDFSYIEHECEKLGLADYEFESRKLCRRVFGVSDRQQPTLSNDEQNILECYFYSGVYGTTERMIQNRMNEYGVGGRRASKSLYVLRRVFPGEEVYRYYPFVNEHRWLLPVFYIWRIVRLPFIKERRERVFREWRGLINGK